MRDPQQISRRRLFLRTGIIGVSAVTTAYGAHALWEASHVALAQQAAPQNVCLQWNSATLQAIRDIHPGPPIVARALAIVNTCMYDAWSAYHAKARPTRPNGIPKQSDRLREQPEAISFAAYRALVDLFPTDEPIFTALMTSLGYDATNTTTALSQAAGIGNVSAAAVLTFRHADGSNQAHGYADTTGYPAAFGPYPAVPQPLNTPDVIHDPNHWQPLRIADGKGGSVVQTYIGPHWGLVTPFALRSGEQFRPEHGPAVITDEEYLEQAQQVLAYSANLTDTHKAIAEYWRDGPHSEQPPGHWILFGQWISQRDRHTLDEDIHLFFALANALFDASIAVWDTKRYYTSERPITAIHYLFQGKQVKAWAGPCQGAQSIAGEQWQPYQPLTIVTPPFPEYVSGHSGFSAAAAEILTRFTHSDRFGLSVTIPAHSSTVEACTPATDITLRWSTFTDAADQAGRSRRYGGIHFPQGDLVGRQMGRSIGSNTWDKVQDYLNGEA